MSETNLSGLRMTHPAINDHFDNVWFVHDDSGHVNGLASTDSAPAPINEVKRKRDRYIQPSVSLHGDENRRWPIFIVSVSWPMVTPICLLLQHPTIAYRQQQQQKNYQ